MSAQRQQRTNFSRTKVKPGAPPVRQALLWRVEEVAGAVVSMTILGSTEELVRSGVPAFVVEETGATAVSVELIGPAMYVTMSEEPSDGEHLMLALNSNAVRNGFGAQLSAGVQELVVTPEPPEPNTLTYGGTSGAETVLNIGGGGGPNYCNDSLIFADDTEPQNSTGVRIDGNQLFVSWAVMPVSGTTISWGDGAGGYINANGGVLEPGGVVVP